MDITITSKQYNLLLEYERRNYDLEYKEQYDRIKDGVINYLNNMIEYYSEDDDTINIYDGNKKRLYTYRKLSKELYFNRDIVDLIGELFPTYIWARHGQYIISDLFNLHFDNEVKYVTPAGMN